MALTDTFIRQIKHSGAPAGDKHTDGQGLLLLVKAAGKYWRFNYRYADKQKTLALGVYPEVSLAKARKRREEARELLADGKDPGQAKREEKIAKIAAANDTFEKVARSWLEKLPHHAQKVLRENHHMAGKSCIHSNWKMPITDCP